MDNSYILGMVLIIVVIILMIIALLYNQKSQRRKNIMDAVGVKDLKSGVNPSKTLSDRKVAEIAKNLKDTKGEKEGLSISDRIKQAGLEISVGKFWMFSSVSMVSFILLAMIMGAPQISYILFAIIGLLGFPRFVLHRITVNRQKKFLENFSDALDSMVRMLKAGMPPSETISMASQEFDGPLGEEMARIYDSQKMGIPMNEAVLAAAERMPIPEMRMFATGMAIQQETGASLSEVLTNLSALIRARFRLQRKVHALSAEAKASAGIIGALPIVVAGGLYFINPEYIMLLFTEPTGQKLLVGAILWMGVGVAIMKQMINFKV